MTKRHGKSCQSQAPSEHLYTRLVHELTRIFAARTGFSQHLGAQRVFPSPRTHLSDYHLPLAAPL